MTSAVLSILGAKTKIELTSVRTRVGKSPRKTADQILLVYTFLVKLTHFYPCKKWFPTNQKINQQNYDTVKTAGTYL